MTKCPFTVGQKSLHGHMFVLHHRAPMDTTTVGHDFAVIRGASESPCHEGFLATFRVAKTHWWIVADILRICVTILKYIKYPQISNFRSRSYWACLRCWVFAGWFYWDACTLCGNASHNLRVFHHYIERCVVSFESLGHPWLSWTSTLLHSVEMCFPLSIALHVSSVVVFKFHHSSIYLKLHHSI